MTQYLLSLNREIELYHQNSTDEKQWYHLERIHILSQLHIKYHYNAHWMMLCQAFKEKNIHEVVGQIIRIICVFPGHIFRKLPIGNVGSSRVSMF